MSHPPVVVVESGGVPRTQVAEGASAPAYTVVESGARPITLADNCPPIALFNPDGSHYVAVGTELLVNGAFDTDLSGWSDFDAGTGVSSWDAGRLKLVGTDSTTNRAARVQSFATVIGATYEALADAEIVTGLAGMLIGTTAMGAEIGAVFTSASAGTYSLSQTFVATATTTYISFRNGGTSPTEAYIDNASVIRQ